MATKKVVSLTAVKQLMDLNEGLTNFDVTFTAKSLDNSDFYALVVDQATLDSNSPLDFKLANGSISANIISDKNVFQNHFLCLKSDKPCQVEVVIDKKEIEPRVQNHSTMQQHNLSAPSLKPPTKPSKINWVLIFIVVALGACALGYYFIYSKNKKSITTFNINATPVSIPEENTSSILPEFESPNPYKKSKGCSLEDRLSKLLEI
jgi:hypothetical protein